MKKIYVFSLAVLIVIMAINVNIAHNNEKKARISWSNTMALTSNEAKMLFSYDASGNMTNREWLPAPLLTPPPPNGTDSIGIAVSLTDSIEFASGTVASMTKSAVADAGNTVFAAEIPIFGSEITEMEVTIYPNPTKGIFQLDITGMNIPQGARIEIFAANGNLLGRWPAYSGNTFDITDKPGGMYIVRLTLDKNYVNSWKIIKE